MYASSGKIEAKRAYYLDLVPVNDLVNLVTHQQGDSSHIHPQHQDNNGGEAAVRGAVIAELRDIESESNRGDRNQNGGDHIAGRKKPELRFFSGPIPVSHGKGQQPRGGNDDPPQSRKEGS